MGQRGPKPQPVALRLIRGDPGKRAIDLSDGVQPEVAVPTVPKWLCDEARKEWKRITPELIELGLLTKLDATALGLYCQTYGRLQQVERALSSRQALVESEGGDAADALVQTTPTGFRRESVMARMAADLRAEVDRYLAAFGMSPSSRARVSVSRNDGQQSLPGLEQPQGWAAFR